MRNRFLTFFAWLQMLSVFPTLPERSKTVAHPKQNKKCHVLAQILQIGMIPHNITSFKFICALYQFHRQTLFITKIGAKSNFESMFQLVPYIYNASNKDLFLKSPRNVKNSKFPVTSFYVLITARVICPTAELLVNIGYRESIWKKIVNGSTKEMWYHHCKHIFKALPHMDIYIIMIIIIATISSIVRWDYTVCHPLDEGTVH